MSWQIDYAHSEINFTVRHMMVSRVRGQFESFSGEIKLDEEHSENTEVSIQIDANSISTAQADRDGHLTSPDFLDAERYPHITFQSKRVDVKGKDRAKLIGDLTIRDVTKEVALDVTYEGQAKSPFANTIAAGFLAETTINRTEWGLTWNAMLETGGVLVGEDIKISIELELTQDVEEPVEAVAAD
ncbi:MAG: YceI family protein [Litorilinea sp.]